MMKSYYAYATNSSFAIFVVLWIGCSGRAMAPVQGTVTLPDGKPLVGGTVTFDNAEQNLSASGETNDKGTYKISTFDAEDGIPPGTYRVSVSQPHAADSSQGEPPRLFPRRYENAQDSQLQYTVQKGDNVFDIKLESK